MVCKTCVYKQQKKNQPLNGILKPFCSFRMIVTNEDQLVSRSLIKANFLGGIGMIPRIQHSAIVSFFFSIFPGSSETGQETSKTTKRAYLCQCHKSSKFVIIISFFSCFWIKISIKSVIDSNGVHMAGFSPHSSTPSSLLENRRNVLKCKVKISFEKSWIYITKPGFSIISYCCFTFQQMSVNSNGSFLRYLTKQKTNEQRRNPSDRFN